MTTDTAASREASAASVVADALTRFRGRIALACSFGGTSGMALLDIALRLDPRIPVFVIDTEVLFPQTYALLERVEQRYGISVARVRPRQTIAKQAVTHGDELWLRDPDACCELRKVEPLAGYLRDFDAWITAIRRDQSATRADVAFESLDARNGVVKIAPLANWTEDDVRAYIDRYALPVNDLHAEGYTSIGCTFCTRRPLAGDDVRSGRWAGTMKTECGIHGGPRR